MKPHPRKQQGSWRNLFSPMLPLLIFSGLILSGGCCFIESPTGDATEIVGGEAQVEILKNPDKVSAFRIHTDQEDHKKETITAGPVPVTPEQAERLTSLLLSNDSYEWETVKGCVFMPGVLIVYETANGKSEIRLCYECNIVGFDPGTGEDFDPIAIELIAWTQDIFPNDAEIQNLKP